MALIKYLQRPSKCSSALLLLAAVLHIFLTQAALAQEGAIPDACKHFISPLNGLNYESELHRRWYVSWWDGKCDGLPPWPLCQSRPYWETIAEPVLKQYPDADRKTLLKELCTMGQTLGHEFARDNNWRCIDRDDLSAWAARIGSSRENIFQTITEVRSEAEAKIRRAKQDKSC